MPGDGVNPVELGATNITALSRTKENYTLPNFRHHGIWLKCISMPSTGVNAPRLKGIEEQIITK